MVVYYAIFEPDDGGFSISFPDLKGALTCGDTMDEALFMAKDVLAGWLVESEDVGEFIPVPSDSKNIEVPEDALLIPIEVDVELARKNFNHRVI